MGSEMYRIGSELFPITVSYIDPIKCLGFTPKITCIFYLSTVSGSLPCPINSFFQCVRLTQASYLMFSYPFSSFSDVYFSSVPLDDQNQIDHLHSLIKDSKHQRGHTFYVRPILELKKFLG